MHRDQRGDRILHHHRERQPIELVQQLSTFRILAGITWALGLWVCTAGHAVASTIAVQDFSGINFATSRTDDRAFGWQFTASVDITIDSVGLYDHRSDGFASPHQVAIWNSVGTLLASASLRAGTASPTSGSIVNGGTGIFRFESIAPLAIAAGQDYVIAFHCQGCTDPFYFNTTSASLGAELIGYPTSANERASVDSGGFFFPEQLNNRIGYFGPNFTYAAVPEPATAPLLALCLGALAARRRRHRRSWEHSGIAA